MPDPIVMTILALCAVAAVLLGLILRRLVLGSRPQREEELRTTLYSIGDAVISTDERGFVRQMNPIAERLTGWREQEARGRSLSEVFVIAHELSGVPMENPVARVLREGVVVGLANHTVLIARDGTERPIADSGAPIRGQDGSIRGVVLVFRDQSAERAAARALEASQEKYRLLVEDLDVGILMADPAERVTFANPAAQRTFGVPEGSLAGRSLKEFLSDEEFARIREQTSRRRTGKRDTYEITIRRADGEQRRIQVTAVAQKNEAGDFVGTFGTMQDITETAALKQRVEEERRLLVTLMENIPDNIYFKDLQGRFLLNNKSHARLLGCSSPQELLGKTDFDFFSPDYAKRAYSDEQRIVRTGDPVIDTVERLGWPDRPGEWMSTTKMPLRDARGNIIGTFGVSRDITERRCVEEALQQSEEHFRNMFTNAPFGVFQSTLEGKLLQANPALAGMFGYASAEELIETVNRTSLAEVIYENPRVRARIMEEVTAARGGWIRLTDSYRRKDGQMGCANLSIRTYRGAPGAEVGLEGFVEDITERVRAEQEQKRLRDQLQQSQKMEAVGRLAGGIAHDFNNLLTVINGFTEMALGRGATEGELRDDLHEIKRATRRAATLTSQLLAFSRKQILQPRVLDLGELIGGMQEMLNRLLGEDVLVHVHRAEGLWCVLADPGRIEQVVMNLSVNSRDAMPEGGVLSIEMSNVVLSEDYSREHIAVRKGDYVLLAVSDTGHGMSDEVQSRLFEPFFTTKEKGKGTGLGLSTVYGIVKQSDGYVFCYSAAGKGTTFKIYLPRAEGQPQNLRPIEPSARPVRGTEVIMLVEDDEAVRRLTATILESGGYTVLPAANGAEALRKLAAVDRPLDLLITDVVMPGMDGSEVAHKVSSRFPSVSVLYISGYTEDAIVHNGVLDPHVEFIQKPLDGTTLLAKVRSILDRP
jgi:PAS domain S-box-containing protein